MVATRRFVGRAAATSVASSTATKVLVWLVVTCCFSSFVCATTSTCNAFLTTTSNKNKNNHLHRRRLFSSNANDCSHDENHHHYHHADAAANDSSSFHSKSTGPIEPTCSFYEGSEVRKQKLHAELDALGVNVTELLTTTTTSTVCTAALRTYTSFVLPKSRGAWAVAEHSPTRPRVVANQIYFLLQEYNAYCTSWLRNHDRTLEEMEKTQRAQQQDDATNHRCPPTIYVVLDNVRSAANVGTILRTCEAFAVHRVCLCGSMTPSPPFSKEVLKTAVGSADYVSFSVHNSTIDCLRQLKQEQEEVLKKNGDHDDDSNNNSITIVGVETTSKSIPLWDFITNNTDMLHQSHHHDRRRRRPRQALVFVFGNELVGIHPQILEKECDTLISIPTFGIKNSFNVASCVSIVLWEVVRQWHHDADDGESV